MRSGLHSHIDALERRQWNALSGTHIPFLRHEFLSALEHTGCIGARMLCARVASTSAPDETTAGLPSALVHSSVRSRIKAGSAMHEWGRGPPVGQNRTVRVCDNISNIALQNFGNS